MNKARVRTTSAGWTAAAGRSTVQYEDDERTCRHCGKYMRVEKYSQMKVYRCRYGCGWIQESTYKSGHG